MKTRDIFLARLRFLVISKAVIAPGFSHSTCFPECRQACVIRARNLCGVAINTASIFLFFNTSSRFLVAVQPGIEAASFADFPDPESAIVLSTALSELASTDAHRVPILPAPIKAKLIFFIVRLQYSACLLFQLHFLHLQNNYGHQKTVLDWP